MSELGTGIEEIIKSLKEKDIYTLSTPELSKYVTAIDDIFETQETIDEVDYNFLMNFRNECFDILETKKETVDAVIANS